MSRGRFITFEGIEGSGKSSQIARLQARLEAAGRAVVRLREPGGTRIGDRIREVLLDPAARAMRPETEMYLFAASRAQLVQEAVRPALASGVVVLCDRFLHSSLAYQGGGRGLGRDRVHAVNAPAVNGCLPDRVLLMDLEPERALERAAARGALDRIEQEKRAFFETTRGAFLDEARHDPDRFAVIDADGSLDEVEGRVLSALRIFFPELSG